MSQRDVFDHLTTFFDGLPDVVRAEISLLLVVLADDQPVDADGWIDCEQVARGLFNAQSRFGRFGDLIKAVGIFDVYFAADPYDRLAPAAVHSGSARSGARHAASGGNQFEARRRQYAAKLAAIEKACRDWHALRQTSLASAAISAALMPSFAPASRHTLRANSRRAGRQDNGDRQVGM
jgi:hypothetical protein